MNTLKLFALNILVAIMFVSLVGCAQQPFCAQTGNGYFCLSTEDSADAEALARFYQENGCTTDTECEALDPYLEQVDIGESTTTTLHDALALKAICDSDPEDKMDYQECP